MGMGFKELQGEDVHASNFSAGVSCEVALAWHCWHFACRYVSSEQSLFIWRGRRKKCKAAVARNQTQSPWLELPILWPLSYDHWTTTGQPQALIILSIYCTRSTECFRLSECTVSTPWGLTRKFSPSGKNPRWVFYYLFHLFSMLLSILLQLENEERLFILRGRRSVWWS